MVKKIAFLLKVLLTFALSSGIGFAQTKNQASTTSRKGISTSGINPENALIRCATDEYEALLQKQNPKRKTRAKFEAWLQPLIENYKTMRSVSSESNGIITIPVVVHVIHSGQPVGTAPNITDAQVQSQIRVLNNDFRKLAGTPGFNTNPVGADIQIQFTLAKVDPDGNPTNGINHANLCEPSWSVQVFDFIKAQTIWDPTQYLNMWSVNFSEPKLYGYAQFPSDSGLPGIDEEGIAETDGVVAQYNTFGSIDYNDGTFILEAPNDKGRVMTHEVGHWLGLRHIWGDGGCSATDYCADTPNAAEANRGCPINLDTCPEDPGLDMVQNYMDYTDGLCMNIFTADQKARMIAVINNATRRTTLKTSTKDLPIPLFANDAGIKIERACSTASCGSAAPPVQTITLTNRGTGNLTSASLDYTVNGGTANTYNWTGNLDSDQFATFDMPVAATASGPIVVTVTSVNGTADQRTSNNSAIGTFTLPGSPNFNYTQVTFTLQRDYYSSKTTWTLKNGAGITLYSGGPYDEMPEDGPLPAVITQQWDLPANGCYIFQINDSAGGGLCCYTGNGFYNVKSADGTVTLISGGSFITTESKSFTNNALSIGEFATSSAIYVYPNPSKTNLNIAVPAAFGLPDNYVINNYLGQKLEEKKITTENDLSINTSVLSKGIYLITIAKDSQRKTLRFIKE